MSANIETVLQSLTLDEKISLLAGQDFWQTVPVPEKGVPAIKVSHCLGAGRERTRLTLIRQAMDPMAPEANSLREARELHVFQQPYAQLRHGALLLLAKLAMH
jgi:hypothetical protein